MQTRILTTLAAAALLCTAAFAQAPAAPAAAAAGSAAAKPVATAAAAITPQSSYGGPTEVAQPLGLTVGKSSLVRLSADAARLSVGNPEVADVTLINPREVYLLAKKVGSTNVFVWTKSGRTTLIDVVVGLDTVTLRSKLQQLVPSETRVSVEPLGDAVVLSGPVADAMKAHRLVSLAETYGGARKVVNMLTVEGNQQVMLEVKVAEVSKTLMDKLGAQFDITRTSGNTTVTLLSQLLSGGAGTVGAVRSGGRTAFSLDAEIDNGLVKILAEPTIMAISGQEGTFLAGGKIYIPVPQTGTAGTTVTLEEKEFGVGLRFTPTLLDEGRINLRVTPEVSELSQIGTTLTANGQTSVLPTITTRRASTTVQLRDGESFAIGGLIKSNVTEAVKAFPGLGEVPVLGALFRSTEFQTDRSELLFIVTPRLVKPLPPNYALPTDSFVPPTRAERLLEGRVESATPPAAPAAPVTAPAPARGGFQLN